TRKSSAAAEPRSKTQQSLAVGCSAWLDRCVEWSLLPSHDESRSALSRWLRLRGLEIGMRFLELRMRLFELRMSLCQTRIFCIERGHLSGDKTYLRTNRVLWRVGINHPIKVINIFMECFHRHWCYGSNETELSHRWRQRARQTSKTVS